MKDKAVYIWDENLIYYCDRLPAVVGRASMVHSLITAYNLLNDLKVIRSEPAQYEKLRLFHSELYLDHLKTLNNINDEYITCAEDEEYGLGYDCPPVSNMYDLVSAIAGGSITAAKCLVLGLSKIVINWCGGWHHAHRFGAEGFCYVNDIVLAIEVLKEKFPNVMYIDLDVHHGNGVQDAYSLSKSVFTLSFHKHEPGFYPGTGNVNDIGALNGKGYSCNFPLHAFYSDTTIDYVFTKVFELVYEKFSPDAIVVQCGADALAHDPHGGAQLTTTGYFACLQRVLQKQKPTMLLGGGGYKHPNVARLWTSITGLVAGIELEVDIPEHNYWPQYGPDYMLNLEPMLTKDSNKMNYLDECFSIIEGNIRKYLTKRDNELESKSLKNEFDNTTKKKMHKYVTDADNKPNCVKRENIDVYEFNE